MHCPECKCYYNTCYGHECKPSMESVAEMIRRQGGYQIEYGPDGLACRMKWTPPTPTQENGDA